MWLLNTNKKAQSIFKMTFCFCNCLIALLHKAVTMHSGTRGGRGGTHVSVQLSPQAVQECCSFPTPLAFFFSPSPQTVSLSPTAEISMDSLPTFFHTTSSEPAPLITKNPSFEAQLPEDSKQRVNKGFRVSEILGNTNSYRSSILEFFTNFAK